MEKALRERIVEAKKCVEEAIYMLYKLSNDLSSSIHTSTSTDKNQSLERILRDVALRLSVAIAKLRECHKALKEVVYMK